MLIMNPFRFRCPSCRAVLTMGRSGALLLTVGCLPGFALGTVAMHMKDHQSWSTTELLLWFLVACPAAIVAYEWLSWRYARLAVRTPGPQ